MFAYGGHGAFPTIQHDMKKPYHFKRSVFIAFLIVMCLYLPVSLLGYISYGDSLQSSIIPSIQVRLVLRFCDDIRISELANSTNCEFIDHASRGPRTNNYLQSSKSRT